MFRILEDPRICLEFWVRVSRLVSSQVLTSFSKYVTDDTLQFQLCPAILERSPKHTWGTSNQLRQTPGRVGWGWGFFQMLKRLPENSFSWTLSGQKVRTAPLKIPPLLWSLSDVWQEHREAGLVQPPPSDSGGVSGCLRVEAGPSILPYSYSSLHPGGGAIFPPSSPFSGTFKRAKRTMFSVVGHK